MNDPRFRGIGMTSQRTRERLVAKLREEGIDNETVLQVIRTIPRHFFVDEALGTRAYENTALPIGYGQTISQPLIVARMTDVLLAGGDMKRVLEIGTGSGYQTAVLAQLVEEVFTVERISGLLRQARTRLRELGVRNVRFKHDDGHLGWAEQGPFDGIIITAAPNEVPMELVNQLRIGGRMVVPAGLAGQQALRAITRTEQGAEEEILSRVSFVPLVNGTG